MAETVFAELMRYVQFGEADASALQALHSTAARQFERISVVFYDRILAHEEARKALLTGESQVGCLKVKLVAWMDGLLKGPWDEAYWENRYRIGRVHVRIALPQHYMFGAMSVIREELTRVAWERFSAEPAELERVLNALDKILDLELAIMLHTYREDLVAQQARTERLSTFGQMVGSIGHELRNPLGAIKLALHLLRRGVGMDERAKRHLDRIGDQLAVAQGIITNLLDTIQSRPLSKKRVDLVKVIAGSAESVERPAGVSMALVGLEALPRVAGDPAQLRQVFTNLIENAVFAASPKGAVTVHGRQDTGGVELDVEDTGPGVEAAIRWRLFEPLITTKAKGTGLGLALVKRIAERHGGSVRYSDRPGGGARFTVRLTAWRRRAMRHYLIVDDNRDFAENLAEIVRNAGSEVEIAGNGREALELARTHRYDALLTDMRMPLMGGAELVHEIRQLDPGAAAMVITAYVGDRALETARKDGLLAVLPKPVSVERILELLSAARRDGLVAVVEDDTSLSENLCEALRSKGFSAVTASSVPELERLGPLRPCCALVDLHVPGGPDGEAMKRLAQKYPGLPMIVVTGCPGVPPPLPHAGYFTKPFDTARLLSSVERLHRASSPPVTIH